LSHREAEVGSPEQVVDTLGTATPDIGEALGGRPYAELTAAFRVLQDRMVAATGMSAAAIDQLRTEVEGLGALLERFHGNESDQWSARRPDLPGEGAIVMPPYVIDRRTERTDYGRVTFSRLFLGRGWAAHGGAQGLLFDDAMGRVVHRVHTDGWLRTAYLHLNYRQIAPIDQELSLEVSLVRIAGRKHFVTGRLSDATGAVLVDADGLFLTMLPGQP
jgi:hypothetical protein